LFVDAGVPCDVTDNLARAHWEKLTWNIPFNGLGVASSAGWPAVMAGQAPPGLALSWSKGPPPGSCLTTDQLLADPRWEGLVRDLILEVIQAARAIGYDLADSLVETQIQRTLTMGAYKPSTLIDFERGQALELESLFLEPLRQAKKAGVPTPRLENLTRVLQQLRG
jgi:2-dehydropantoate 2-reductase